MRRNSCPKESFWRVNFFSAPLRFSDVLRANLNGAEEKRTLQKHPFGQPFLRATPSLLLWRASDHLSSRGLPLAQRFRTVMTLEGDSHRKVDEHKGMDATMETTGGERAKEHETSRGQIL